MSNPTKHHGSSFASNIPRYFIYLALKGFGFGLITAMWLIFLQQRRGFSLSQATLDELPTGIVADTLGRKASLAAGTALMSLSIFAWAFAPTLPLIMLAYVGLAIGTTFLSGAEDALLFESVQRAGRGDAYTRLVGRAGATMLAATALGNVASGLLATVDLILPFLVTLVVFSFEMLPTAIASSALFVSMKMVTLVAFVLVCTLLYLRKVKESSFREGPVLGLTWVAIFVALDITHYTFVHPPFDVGKYFATDAPPYVIIPIITTLLMGYLKPKVVSADSADAVTAATPRTNSA